MGMFTEQEAKAILDKVIALSTADECTATLNGSIDARTASVCMRLPPASGYDVNARGS